MAICLPPLSHNLKHSHVKHFAPIHYVHHLAQSKSQVVHTCTSTFEQSHFWLLALNTRFLLCSHTFFLFFQELTPSTFSPPPCIQNTSLSACGTRWPLWRLNYSNPSTAWVVAVVVVVVVMISILVMIMRITSRKYQEDEDDDTLWPRRRLNCPNPSTTRETLRWPTLKEAWPNKHLTLAFNV